MFNRKKIQRLEQQIVDLQDRIRKINSELHNAAYLRVYDGAIMSGGKEISVARALESLYDQLGFSLKLQYQDPVSVSLVKKDASRPEAAVS